MNIMMMAILATLVCVVYLTALCIYRQIDSALMRRRIRKQWEAYKAEHPDALEFPVEDDDLEDEETEQEHCCHCVHNLRSDIAGLVPNGNDNVRDHSMRLNLPDSLYERLCIESEDAGVTKAEYMRKVLTYTFNNMDLEAADEQG